jgi:hypothetical protein
MKVRRNPLVVGLLGVLALGVAFWNVVGPMVGRLRVRRAAPAVAAAAPGTSTLAVALPQPSPADPGALPPILPINQEAILGRFTEWLEAPGRDPFEFFVPAEVTQGGPRAAELLSLKAIWRQAGGQLAVINNVVLGEGEQIAGFKLERIEADSVWVRGTNGSERVEFSAIPTTLSPAPLTQ